MDRPGWLTRQRADVPPGVDWLGRRERRALARFRIAPRRSDWLLGRWTAKAAISEWLSVAPDQVEVLAAQDGAPEVLIHGEPSPLSVSLSHRGGRAIAVVSGSPVTVGCDLEIVEERSDAFVREWLGPDEQGLVDQGGTQRDLIANLIWTAKEAAAKVRREGLRLDVRHAVVRVGGTFARPGEWHELRVEWIDGTPPTSGWWRTEPGWVMCVAGDPKPGAPRLLSTQPSSRLMSRSA